jgi:hypothetical protein
MIHAVEWSQERMHRTLAGVYLRQALDAFRAAGSSDGLYVGSIAPMARGWASDDDAKLGVLHGEALHQQQEHCRTAILFAALACEAYVNEYLQERLGDADFKAVDRLPTLEKLVVGCRLVDGPQFQRGEGDGQVVGELFRLRHKLVHPRKGVGRYPRAAELPRRHDDFNPTTAVQFIQAVARVGDALIASAFPDPQRPDSPSFEIVRGAKYLTALARDMEEALPDYDDEPLPDLVNRIRQDLF